MSKMKMGNDWTIHVPDKHDGPYGMFYSCDNKAEFEEIILSLKRIKEGHHGMMKPFPKDPFAYTNLSVVTPEIQRLHNDFVGAEIATDDSKMDLDVKDDQSENVKLDPHCRQGFVGCRPMTAKNESQAFLRDEEMADADKALDEAILELDKEEKQAKDGFDELVEQFDFLTRSMDDSSQQIG